MTLTTAGKNWLATNAGVSSCFSASGVSFVDADGVPFTAGTKDVVITFIGAHMVGTKDDAIIIAGTSYNGFKAINGGSDLAYPDATWVGSSDGHPGATLPLYCAPSAHVVSATLVVDQTECAASCTVTGTVSWTNSGDAASAPMDLQVTVNSGTPTTVATGVVINPGTTTSVYPFSLPDLPIGTYSICASPDSGTACKTVIVVAPANIVATAIIPAVTTCVAPCDTTVDITWTNNGATTGNFTPTITVNGTPASSASEPLGAGASVTRTFTITGLAAGNHEICAIPNTLACVTIVVTAPVSSASFTSTPSGAMIYIDGSETSSGVTPFTVTNLSIGLHTYILTNAECYAEATGEFTTVIGSTVDVPVTFDTAARFESSPVGARIWVDGIDKGVNTPHNVTGLTVGEHTYTLKKLGYVDLTGPFTTVLCQRVNVPANLSHIQEAGMGGLMMLGLAFGALLIGKRDDDKKKTRESPTKGSQIRESPTKGS